MLGGRCRPSLDVEWAHAIAPAASILLVERHPGRYQFALERRHLVTANQPGVSVVSMSWGATEFNGETADDSVFTTPAGTLAGRAWRGALHS